MCLITQPQQKFCIRATIFRTRDTSGDHPLLSDNRLHNEKGFQEVQETYQKKGLYLYSDPQSQPYRFGRGASLVWRAARRL